MNFKDSIIKNMNFYFDNLNNSQINQFCNILIENKENNILILGIGKSQNAGLQLCDLLRCINFKSILLDPSKLLHGDIGIISGTDIVITLSNSGNTKELYNITKVIKETKTNKIYLLSSKENGKIIENVIDNFIIPIDKELKSCFELIPTNSYLNFILYFNQVIGIIIEKLNINQDTYKKNHTSGNISKLYERVLDNIIIKKKCSILSITSTIKDLILSQNKYNTGCSVIIDNDKVCGFITDKDLRIYLEKNNNLSDCILEIANDKFSYIDNNILLKDISSKYLYIPVIIDGIFEGIFTNSI